MINNIYYNIILNPNSIWEVYLKEDYLRMKKS